MGQMVPNQEKFRTLADTISARKTWLRQVLPKAVDSDRFVKVTLAAITKTPALLGCSQETVVLSILQAAQLGLEPTGVLGSAYLVPYGNACTLVVGYRGLIDLARRSGQIQTIEAHVVHAKDKFRCTYGLNPVLEHEPDWSEDPGPLVFVYAMARLKDGGVQYEVMSRAQVEAIRNKSKAGRSGPWVDHFEEMARKTVIRRLAKYLPLTVEAANAIENADRIEQGEQTIDAMPVAEFDPATLDAAQEPPAADALKAKLRRVGGGPKTVSETAGMRIEDHTGESDPYGPGPGDLPPEN